MNNDVVCVGKINIDLFYKVESLQVNDNHVADSLLMNVGGKAANVSIALSKLGIKTSLIAKIGKDHFGRFASAMIKKFGVDSFLTMDKIEQTGLTFVVVDKEGNNTMFNYIGANKNLTIMDLEKHKTNIVNAKIVYVQAGLNEEVIKYLKRLNKNVFLELTEHIPPAILSDISYVSLNKQELEKTALEKTVERGIKKLLSWGINEIYLKLGSYGSAYFSAKESIFSESFKINPVDTTGAGDAFTAGIIFGIINNLPKSHTLKIANACGAITATKKGISESIPTLEELSTFLKNNDNI